MNTPKRILIRMPNWLGDAVMGTPILQDLKTHMPNTSITVLCHEAIHNLLQQNPFIDDFLIFSREKKRASSEKRRIYDAMQNAHFDAGILLTRSFSSAWWFFRGNVRRRIGFCDHLRFFLLTDRFKIPENEETEHQVITYKRLLQAFDIPISTTSPMLFLQNEEQAQAKQLLAEHGIASDAICIGINPGAAFGSAKCWPSERFIELTNRLQNDPRVRVVFFGDSFSKPLVDTICKACHKAPVNLATKTNLRMLLALISCCKVFVSNDSGPMHVAAALKTPLVALFGSTNEVKTGPYGSATIIHKHVACSPCYLRTCPIDFRCMKSIYPDEVLNAVQRIAYAPFSS